MSGSTENRAYGASEKPERTERVLDLETARGMLPLVRSIVADLVQGHQRIASLTPELDRLDRTKRTLAWPQRQRRYEIRDEITRAEGVVRDATAELESLQVAVLDAEVGRIGFPTLVNENRAFFSWRPGEETLGYWHFAGETVRRAIPANWNKPATRSVSSKR